MDEMDTGHMSSYVAESSALSSTPTYLVGLLPVSGVDRVDDIHTLNDFAEWGETHPVQVPIVHEIDEDLSMGERRVNTSGL